VILDGAQLTRVDPRVHFEANYRTAVQDHCLVTCSRIQSLEWRALDFRFIRMPIVSLSLCESPPLRRPAQPEDSFVSRDRPFRIHAN
jgi:hypothetical protein